MNIYMLTVMRNESDRYLKDFLSYHYGLFDGIAIYDDQSTDTSVAIARSMAAEVKIREDDRPSFLEHEGQFREDAWRWLAETFVPDDTNWVFAIDVDEFYVGDRDSLVQCIEEANILDSSGVEVSIPEVFSIAEDGVPWVRTDGFWGGLSCVRLCRFPNDLSFADKSMACGAVPVEANKWVYAHDPYPTLLHYGYARSLDRINKFNRYESLSGHNPNHINSILQPSKLVKWEGSYPKVRHDKFLERGIT